MSEEKKICAWCHYARMRDDICGIYCTGGFENQDGSCMRFLDSKAVNMDAKKLEELLPQTEKDVPAMALKAAAFIRAARELVKENEMLRAQLAASERQRSDMTM